MNAAEIIFGIVFIIVIGIPNGFRFVNGRWAYLEQPEHKALKTIVSILLGALFGYILVAWTVVKWFAKLAKMLIKDMAGR